MNWMTQIALKYFISKKKDNFVSFTGKISFFSIAFSVAMLIVAISVIKGFEESVITKVLNDQGHIMIFEYENFNPEATVQKIKKTFPEIECFPVIDSQALILKKNFTEGVIIKGLCDEKFDELVKKNNIKILSYPENAILIGEKLAKTFFIKKGDKINLLIPVQNPLPFGIVPEIIECTVVEIVKFDLHDLNRFGIAMKIKNAQEIFEIGSKVNKIICFLKNPKKVFTYREKLQKILPEKQIYTWHDLNMMFADMMRIQKNLVMIILFVIIFLSALSCSASLILLIYSKKKEIVLLKLLNASKKNIAIIFFKTGVFISFFSSIFGALLGIFLTKNVNLILYIINKIFQIEVFNPEIYLLPEIPTALYFSDILTIVLSAFLISSLTSFFSAYKASSVNVIENL